MPDLVRLKEINAQRNLPNEQSRVFESEIKVLKTNIKRFLRVFELILARGLLKSFHN